MSNQDGILSPCSKLDDTSSSQSSSSESESQQKKVVVVYPIHLDKGSHKVETEPASAMTSSKGAELIIPVDHAEETNGELVKATKVSKKNTNEIHLKMASKAKGTKVTSKFKAQPKTKAIPKKEEKTKHKIKIVSKKTISKDSRLN